MTVTAEHANELYEKGLLAFRSGDNELCVTLTIESLDIGRALGDDKVIGQALTGLCRAALRDNNAQLLQSLSGELNELARKTRDEWWRVVVAHMNAEMARMNGDLDRANDLYDKSMALSEVIGSKNMVATECFNKSFVAVAQKEYQTAHELLQRHFAIRSELDEGDINPYGLIAVANLLAAEGRLSEAAEAAFVCRKLLTENNIVPDPADETPLMKVEEQIKYTLPKNVQIRLLEQSKDTSCREIAEQLT